MTGSDYSSSLKIEATERDAEKALTSAIAEWWSKDLQFNETSFTVGFGDTKKTFQAAEITRQEQGFDLVWYCTAANLLHPDVSAPEEWVGTRIIWTVRPADERVAITLTHEGLNDGLQCHEICVGGWNFFFAGSLKKYLETGQGEPFSSEQAA